MSLKDPDSKFFIIIVTICIISFFVISYKGLVNISISNNQMINGPDKKEKGIEEGLKEKPSLIDRLNPFIEETEEP